MPTERRVVVLTGTVQGVGFRPFVHRIASDLGLHGFVRNDRGGVVVEAQGCTTALDRFLSAVVTEAPRLARIDRVEWTTAPPGNELAFAIGPSDEASAGPPVLAPDAATCDACLHELRDPADRRFGYAFSSCTDCGPRLTIATDAPFDRERTTMAGFSLCADCRRELLEPRDRRFHAQTIACPACGPRLTDSLDAAVAAIRDGAILAVKGLGGFHLACDATDQQAVVELRRRKGRDDKPLAIMVSELEQARRLCEVSPAEAELLTGPGRPIVLLSRRPGTAIAEAVAGRNPLLGVMLAYTPLHHLLLDGAGRPLVMTSGNRSDEPIAIDDADARARLAGIADGFLGHDRPIALRCDDSVARVLAGAPVFLRRSRGECPRPIALPKPCAAPILAMGGHLKTTFAIGHAHTATLSPHLGDLDDPAAVRAYRDAVAHHERLLGVRPEILVHDLHPGYTTTRIALARAAEEGLRCIAVQHHHAHLASCMAEHGLDEPVLGVTFDGTGHGLDGTAWGGEILAGDYGGFRRVAHLVEVAMPGGEAAIREPWRMAAAYLWAAGLDAEVDRLLGARQPPGALAVLRRMIERGVNAPLTSSAGRLFDAVAALLGVRDRTRYEGQAAIELEWLARTAPAGASYPYRIADGLIDPLPMVRTIVGDLGRVPPAMIARRFHDTLAEIIEVGCCVARANTGLDRVVLTGGVFMNDLLATEASRRLEGAGFRVFRHRRVPPNDGGLSLGQLAIATFVV